MRLNFNARDPVYKQVMRHFKTRIATGDLEPGQEIPSRRELANTLKINPNTVQRAYKEMEKQGLIRTERNLPSKITRDQAVIAQMHQELLEAAVDEFVEAITPLNVELDELLELMKQKLTASDDEGEGNR